MAVALISLQKPVEAQEKIDRALQIFDQEIGEYFGLSWAALVRGLLGQAQQAEAVELVAVVLHHPLRNLPRFLRTEDPVLSEAAERSSQAGN